MTTVLTAEMAADICAADDKIHSLVAKGSPNTARKSGQREALEAIAEGAHKVLEIPAGLHPQTADLAIRFAQAMMEKLHAAELKYGYEGSTAWANVDWEEDCRTSLYEHIRKGDPRDVANYCAFMWHHGWSTTASLDEFYEEAVELVSVPSNKWTAGQRIAAHAFIKRMTAILQGRMPSKRA